MKQTNLIMEIAALVDAISHAKDVAESHKCTECGNQHHRLVVWLQKLRSFKLKPMIDETNDIFCGSVT